MEQLNVQRRFPSKLDKYLHNFKRKPCYTFCINIDAHRQIVGSLPASNLTVQIRTELDAILPSPAYILQGKQTRAISSNDDSRHSIHNFKVGDHCYALYFGPKQTKWVPAVVVKLTSTRIIQVQTVFQDSKWQSYIDELRP